MPGGKMPNAGRKPDWAEKIMVAVVNKCWEEIEKALQDENIYNLTKKEKLQIVLKVVEKTAPQVVKLDSSNPEGFVIRVVKFEGDK